MSDDEDTNWTIELETSLIEGCDYGQIKQICKSRPLPEHLRAEVWPICLAVDGKSDTMNAFDQLYDLPEQALLRQDCQALVDRLGNDEDEKISVASDVESILTFYCKSRDVKYSSDSGLLEILQPMLALKMGRSDLYNCFYTFLHQYVPRECHKNGRPFHLFRLLLLYHDPELCSFLDTKRVTPDTYALGWFRSLFSFNCDLHVTLNIWDVYLQSGDPFLVFFLALVILVNAKEQVVVMAQHSKQEIIDTLQSLPSALEADDVHDFCSLALYYASKTPQSFRTEYAGVLFGGGGEDVTRVHQALCLSVSAHELLQANQRTAEEGVRYFAIDCRPADQYNSGHLSIAFHLDANLMLQNPTEFATAVHALLSAQNQAIEQESVAGGEHLCFIGSGREEEDQYVNMVVAHFLQRNSQFVSVALGGYTVLHELLADRLDSALTDHQPHSCIVCSPGAVHDDSDAASDTLAAAHADATLSAKLGKLSTVVKSRSAGLKDKMINYIKNEQPPVDKHVSATDRGPRYRGMASVFTIGDDEDELRSATSSDDERKDVVKLETWLQKPDVLHAFTCQELRDSGYMYNSHLLVTHSHLYVLREIPHKRGMAWIQARRALGSIVKITSKKKHPEIITFKYGTSSDEKGIRVTDQDRFVIPKAGEATKVIKLQIMHVLQTLDSAS